MVTVNTQTQKHKIPGSQGYRVDRKGNLIVWGSKHKTLATYAPGSWDNVQCQDQEAQ